ncbi:MAG: hypothetical protein EOP07_10535 [Proteobacteria bacterium]|nr:MAG: hypothetical protein EOP07_10535 [Pseudomonadota bacterium]
MISFKQLQTCVALCGVLTLSASCKEISEDTSGLATDAGNKTVDAGTSEQFNLAEWVAKKGIGGANMKNNIKAGNAYIFFNSAEEQNPDKTNAAELKKSKNKASLLKPEYELRMNATVVSDSKKAEVKSLFWFDGSLNGMKVYPGGNAVEASMVGSAKSGITVKAGLKAFGKDLVSQSVTLVKPFKITKTINLEVKQTVLGIPKIAGIEAGATFVATASVEGETDYLDKESVSISMVPSAKVTAGIQGTVKALLFASATAQGTVTVMDTKLPSNATLGGRVGSGADFLFGNVTFEAATFKALNGEIVIGAKAKLPGKLPPGVEASLWSLTSAVKAGLAKKLAAGWEWSYIVWDSPPFVNVTFPTYYTNGFLQSKAPKAACALPVLTKVVAAATKENAKDTAATKKVGADALAGLKTIQAKAKTIKGTCTAAATTKK